jgi:hypothetical protein
MGTFVCLTFIVAVANAVAPVDVFNALKELEAGFSFPQHRKGLLEVLVASGTRDPARALPAAIDLVDANMGAVGMNGEAREQPLAKFGVKNGQQIADACATYGAEHHPELRGVCDRVMAAVTKETLNVYKGGMNEQIKGFCLSPELEKDAWIARTEARAEELLCVEQKRLAKYYVRVMRHVVKKGANFVRTERQRLLKLLDGDSLTHLKAANFLERVDVLEAFDPEDDEDDEVDSAEDN